MAPPSSSRRSFSPPGRAPDGTSHTDQAPGYCRRLPSAHDPTGQMVSDPQDRRRGTARHRSLTVGDAWPVRRRRPAEPNRGRCDSESLILQRFPACSNFSNAEEPSSCRSATTRSTRPSFAPTRTENGCGWTCACSSAPGGPDGRTALLRSSTERRRDLGPAAPARIFAKSLGRFPQESRKFHECLHSCLHRVRAPIEP
jgi:hypothetical protein